MTRLALVIPLLIASTAVAQARLHQISAPYDTPEHTYPGNGFHVKCTSLFEVVWTEAFVDPFGNFIDYSPSVGLARDSADMPIYSIQWIPDIDISLLRASVVHAPEFFSGFSGLTSRISFYTTDDGTALRMAGLKPSWSMLFTEDGQQGDRWYQRPQWFETGQQQNQTVGFVSFTEFNWVIDTSKTVRVYDNGDGTYDPRDLANGTGQYQVVATWQVFEGPYRGGSGGGEFDDSNIVAAINLLRQERSTDFGTWLEEWQLWESKWDSQDTYLRDTLSNVDLNIAALLAAVSDVETDPTTPDGWTPSQPSDITEADVEDEASSIQLDTGFVPSVPFGSDRSTPPTITLTMPLSVSQAMGGPTLQDIQFTADFSHVSVLVALTRGAILAFVSMQAIALVWSELKP